MFSALSAKPQAKRTHFWLLCLHVISGKLLFRHLLLKMKKRGFVVEVLASGQTALEEGLRCFDSAKVL